MVLGDAVTKLQTFVWIFNHVSRVITWSLFNLRAPNWSNDQPQHDLLYDGVSLSISWNLKLAPVAYATPKCLIKLFQFREIVRAFFRDKENYPYQSGVRKAGSTYLMIKCSIANQHKVPVTTRQKKSR